LVDLGSFVSRSKIPATGSFRKTPEIIEENLENFRPEYGFHIPTIFGVFLPESVRTS
jgi:hypothetical protein